MSNRGHNSIQTPLGRVRYLGSAKSGTRHFWHQRLTAVAMIPLTIAAVIIIVGLALLVLWIPLRQRPGIGTIMNAIEIGIAENIAERFLPDTDRIALRVVYIEIGRAHV